MSPISSGGGLGSPIQEHTAQVITDFFWAQGNLESLGSPLAYINQDGLDMIQLNDARIAPWTFTGLPAAKAGQLFVKRAKIQVLFFNEEALIAEYRKPPRREKIMLYMPLFILRGEIPMFSEAKLNNCLDFIKGELIPLNDVSLHFMAEGSVRPPSQSPLAYINRNLIQGYFKL